jgi:protein-disulfide isomerase
VWILGLLLFASLIASLLMVLAHIESAELPGCGAGSDCTRATVSGWGKLPGTKWPLSFVGFAYFQALLAAFIYSGGSLPTWLWATVRVSAMVSALLIGVMLVEGYVCAYCLTIHVLNIAFVVGGELRWRFAHRTAVDANAWPTLATFAATFAATSILLAVLEYQSTAAASEAAAARMKQALDPAGNRAAGTASTATAFDPGRYYLGPASAKVHVTVVSDYQCPSCRTIDTQVRALTAGESDISISARHFPFCTDCNDQVDKTLHPNSCRAALAAEAAGQVGGANAFWQMHDWLLERRGEFTDDQLQQFVRVIGLDRNAFSAAMQSNETLAVIRSDTVAADTAGLTHTPMVFINGRAIIGKR